MRGLRRRKMSERAPDRSDTAAASGHSHATRENMLIMLAAAIIGLIYGYDLGSIASALLFLVPDFELSTFMTSVVTSAVVLGQLLGAFFAGRISNTIGRKRTMVLVALGYAAVRRPAGARSQRVVLDGRQVPARVHHRRLHRRRAGLHSGVRPKERPGLHDRHLPDRHRLGHSHRLLRGRGPRRQPRAGG